MVYVQNVDKQFKKKNAVTESAKITLRDIILIVAAVDLMLLVINPIMTDIHIQKHMTALDAAIKELK